ncbi:phosphoadenosine phosphosulfate reductase domain-containing protein [Massilia sp. LjRoot122]|uniref:phosphoadenosine phosphosulfate reductase domain-containing protein n=1 Tax=Massilia sp. LjRoot122 TaxID=3342257 RepID=UPI003ECF7526
MRDCNGSIEEREVGPLARPSQKDLPDLGSYDKILCAVSGGKDGIASLLLILEAGVPKDRIEIHHHLVDGKGPNFMDWPVSSSYVRKLGEVLGIRVIESWREGGFLREMLRDGQSTAPVSFETLEGEVVTVGGTRGKPGRRRMFPQVTGNLQQRYCSPALKIDVFSRILTNDLRFRGQRVLVVTGERAEESANRANYAVFEKHRDDLRDGRAYTRHIDHYRPVHAFTEIQVWDVLKRHLINPHPAYHLNWSRMSCRGCIFSGPNEWATVRLYMPGAFEPIASYEREFGVTIKHGESIEQQADRGIPHICQLEMLLLAESENYYADIIVPAGTWSYPVGAFKRGNGPC